MDERLGRLIKALDELENHFDTDFMGEKTFDETCGWDSVHLSISDIFIHI